MIQIVKGSYGRVMPDGSVRATKPGSEPFAASAEIEARLVAQGVAVYVAGEEPAQTVRVAVMPEYDASMKLAELKQIAEAYGVDAEGMKKEAVLAALDVAAGKSPDGA